MVVIVTHTLLYLKQITNNDLLYSTWNRNSAHCYVSASLDRRGLGGGWIHIYVWLTPFTVHLQLS